MNGNSHFIDPQVWVGRDDGSAREVDSFAGEVSSESTCMYTRNSTVRHSFKKRNHMWSVIRNTHQPSDLLLSL